MKERALPWQLPEPERDRSVPEEPRPQSWKGMWACTYTFQSALFRATKDARICKNGYTTFNCPVVEPLVGPS
ncbi:hypothetical protein FKM82_015969 [Ascaphus truei]